MSARGRLFTFAALFGLFSGVVVYFASVAPTKAEKRSEEVATASRPIRKNEFLREEMVRFEPADPTILPADAMHRADLKKFGGYHSKRDISRGEVLRISDFER